MRSLRSRLLVAWVLSVAAALAVGAVLVQLYRQSSEAQSGLGAAVLAQACEAVGETYAFYTAGWAGPRDARDEAAFRRDLEAVVQMALAGRRGLDAGLWQDGVPQGQVLANAPPAELEAAVAAAARDAVAEDEAVGFSASGRRGLACPLGGPVPGVVAWVATRFAAPAGWREVQLGLGALLALVTLTAVWLSLALLAWLRRIRRIEAALAGHARGEVLPRIEPTGERELDRIVDALNAAGARLEEARARSEGLAAQVAAAERLAALGRVAAGVAHEIRNPIAAMRLRAENALAGDAARREAALRAVLEQVARLDRLSGELLAMTQRRVLAPAPVRVDVLLQECAAGHEGGAVAVVVVAPEICAVLDAGLVRRVLDNLVENALRHTPAGGRVTLSAEVAGGMLRLGVADTGPGVDPALRATLFEPFVTGRADGTGLGLAIARELAEAMGGTLRLEDGPGAVFVLEVAWHAC
jgi:signal transduction histidine kinase